MCKYVQNLWKLLEENYSQERYEFLLGIINVLIPHLHLLQLNQQQIELLVGIFVNIDKKVRENHYRDYLYRSFIDPISKQLGDLNPYFSQKIRSNLPKISQATYQTFEFQFHCLYEAKKENPYEKLQLERSRHIARLEGLNLENLPVILADWSLSYLKACYRHTIDISETQLDQLIKLLEHLNEFRQTTNNAATCEELIHYVYLGQSLLHEFFIQKEYSTLEQFQSQLERYPNSFIWKDCLLFCIGEQIKTFASKSNANIAELPVSWLAYAEQLAQAISLPTITSTLSNTYQIPLLMNYRPQLIKMRERYKTAALCNAQENATVDTLKLLNIFVENAVHVLGNPPLDFAICVIGSTSRYDRRPYSDIELIIFYRLKPGFENKVGNELKHAQAQVYLYRLMVGLELQIIGLGETHEETKEKISNAGFHLDSSDHFLKVQLFDTPEQLIQRFIANFREHPNANYHPWVDDMLVYALLNPMLVNKTYGGKELLDNYHAQIQNFLNSPADDVKNQLFELQQRLDLKLTPWTNTKLPKRREFIALGCWYDILSKAVTQLDEIRKQKAISIANNNIRINIKDTFYKPLAYLALTLKLFYGWDNTHSQKLFENLSIHLLTDAEGTSIINLLQYTLNYVVDRQSQLHLENSCQEEIVFWGHETLERQLQWDTIEHGLIRPLHNNCVKNLPNILSGNSEKMLFAWQTILRTTYQQYCNYRKQALDEAYQAYKTAKISDKNLVQSNIKLLTLIPLDFAFHLNLTVYDFNSALNQLQKNQYLSKGYLKELQSYRNSLEKKSSDTNIQAKVNDYNRFEQLDIIKQIEREILTPYFEALPILKKEGYTRFKQIFWEKRVKCALNLKLAQLFQLRTSSIFTQSLSTKSIAANYRIFQTHGIVEGQLTVDLTQKIFLPDGKIKPTTPDRNSAFFPIDSEYCLKLVEPDKLDITSQIHALNEYLLREYAVGQLASLLDFDVIPPGCIIELNYQDKIYYGWLAQCVEGRELSDVIAHTATEPEILKRIDIVSYTQLVLLSLITYPDDGQPRNFMLSNQTNSRGQYRLWSIDNKRNFVEPMQGTQLLFLKTGEKLALKTVLYLLQNVNQPLSSMVLNKSKQQDAQALRLAWMRSLAAIEQQLDKVPSLKQQREQLASKKNPSQHQALGLLLLALYERWRLDIVPVLDPNKNLTALDLLKAYEPTVYKCYQQLQQKIDQENIALHQFHLLFKGDYRINSQGQTLTNTTAEALSKAQVRSQVLAKRLFQQNPQFMQALVWKDMSNHEQISWLKLLQGVKLVELRLAHCRVLNDDDLLRLLKQSSESLKVLDISACPALNTNKVMDWLRTWNTDIEYVSLDYSERLEKVVVPATLKNLQELTLRHCLNLYHVEGSRAKILKYVAVTGSSSVKVSNPNIYAINFVNRSIEKNQLGLYEKALEDLHDAIWLDSQYAEAYYLRGSIFQALSFYEEAFSDFEKAIHLDSKIREKILGSFNKLKIIIESQTDIIKVKFIDFLLKIYAIDILTNCKKIIMGQTQAGQLNLIKKLIELKAYAMLGELADTFETLPNITKFHIVETLLSVEANDALLKCKKLIIDLTYEDQMFIVIYLKNIKAFNTLGTLSNTFTKLSHTEKLHIVETLIYAEATDAIIDCIKIIRDSTKSNQLVILQKLVAIKAFGALAALNKELKNLSCVEKTNIIETFKIHNMSLHWAKLNLCSQGYKDFIKSLLAIEASDLLHLERYSTKNDQDEDIKRKVMYFSKFPDEHRIEFLKLLINKKSISSNRLFANIVMKFSVFERKDIIIYLLSMDNIELLIACKDCIAEQQQKLQIEIIRKFINGKHFSVLGEINKIIQNQPEYLQTEVIILLNQNERLYELSNLLLIIDKQDSNLRKSIMRLIVDSTSKVDVKTYMCKLIEGLSDLANDLAIDNQTKLVNYLQKVLIYYKQNYYPQAAAKAINKLSLTINNLDKKIQLELINTLINCFYYTVIPLFGTNHRDDIANALISLTPLYKNFDQNTLKDIKEKLISVKNLEYYDTKKLIDLLDKFITTENLQHLNTPDFRK